MAQLLYVSGAIPLLLLGVLHLAYTLKDNKEPAYIVPKSAHLIVEMKAEPLRLTSETNMWRAWIGFNISHSMAVIIVGGGYLYLSLCHFLLLKSDVIFHWAGPIAAWVFVILSKYFWFSRPFWGSLVAALLMTFGAILTGFSPI